jgi:LysM repeat protein/uncharacterized protein YvpB
LERARGAKQLLGHTFSDGILPRARIGQLARRCYLPIGGPVLSRRIALSLLFLILYALPSPVQADSPTYHTVAWGETLYSIARLYGISPQSLAEANGLGLNSWVYAGQSMRIPGVASNSPAVSAPQKTPSGIYTIRAGDTLFSISQKFGVSLDALAAANNIPRNGVIYTGWQLKVPGSGTGAVATPSSRPASAAAEPMDTYIVQPGDTLFLVALHYGTTPQAISLANSLPSYFVYSGQRLIVPTASPDAQTSPPPAAEAPDAPAATTGALNALVRGVPLFRQQQTLTCEEAAAAMVLRGALSEAQIVKAMPRSDNPFKGIRGAANFPLYGGLTNYGTYAQGLQKGLAALGRQSTVLYQQTASEFKNAVIAALKGGQAVIWWTTWRQTYQSPAWVKTSSGVSVKLVPYEHTVVIVAVNDRGVSYNDPYDATLRTISWATFQRVSTYFDNMALVVPSSGGG